jgi:amidase
MTASLADIHYLTITELAARLRTPAISPVEVTRTKLQRIDALDGELASFGHLTAEDALDAARRAKREIGHARYRRLHGVPLAIKDLSGTEDAPTAAGMPIHRHFRPARDATAKGRLRQAGAALLSTLRITGRAAKLSWVPRPDNHRAQTVYARIATRDPWIAYRTNLCNSAQA